ncbi:hypothetical protein PPERSA_06452 [Pseudocohnilembus persalinus]|uniref:DNA-directed RNA polymerase n=1 Tax=Pseudocohnilembus persalinus TaxID=266149 RepID=A0A0V0QR82_PSEPJ|nr:hypothetical protein PPERSA_06452 [Pseudocohnilembus persalinus]|eukprot:KRX04818.1 hypothetical protein PPERSA_06452 [Pseudocohnilembus persalinus]
MQEQITQEDQWKIISCYFQEKGLVSQQIESFESFLDNLNDITRQYGEFRVAVTNQYNLGQDTDTSGRQEYRFKIISIRKNDNMIFQGDAIKPMEARLRSLTYSLEYFVDIEQKVFNILDGQEIQQGETQIYQKIKLCDMPIMVRSSLCCLHDLQPSTRIDYGECQLDQGGYFIINGSEKVIVAQERQAYNVVFLFSSKSEKEPWRIEINSMPETGGLPNKFTLVLENDNEQKGFVITAKIKGVNSGVPLFLLMRALGLRSDKEILEAIFYDLEDEDRLDTIQDTLEMLKPSTLQSAGYTNSKDCIKFIGNRTSSDQINKTQEYDEEFFYKRGQGIIQSYLLPHIGKEKASCRNKAFFIGYMVQRLLDAQLGKCGEDDRDHYGNKRIDMAGALMTQLFKEKFLKYIKTATTLTHKFIQEKSKRNKGEFNGQKIQGIKDFFDSTSLTRGLFNALATGNWGILLFLQQ